MADSDESLYSEVDQRDDLMKSIVLSVKDKVDCNDPECRKCDYCQDNSTLS